jgi:hypothetical protein
MPLVALFFRDLGLSGGVFMGFDIWVADDPELHGGPASDFPYFSINNSAMSDLREEMRTQGILTSELDWKLAFCNGDHVSVEEIRAALAPAQEESMTMPDEEGQDMWRRWLAFLRQAVDHGGIVVH